MSCIRLASSRAAGGVFILSAAFAAHAAEDGVATLAQIVVTATRAETSLATVGDSMTIITPEQAKLSQKTAVSDLLSTTPGVTISRNGGFGSTTAVRIRGAEDTQTVVLIDGVKLNDPSSTGGGFNFASLLIDDDARIEVLRGAQSTLWGSQAIGGVVNIVTPEPSGPLAATVDAEAGSYATGTVTARAQAGDERYGWRAGARYFTTDGVSAFDEDLGGREDDGYKNFGAAVRGTFHVTDAVTAELRSMWWRGRFDFDSFPPPTYSLTDTRDYGKTKEWVSYGGLKIDTFDGRLQHRIGVAYTDTERQNIDPDSTVPLTFDAEGSNLRYEYQATLALNEFIHGVFGAERERSSISSASPTTYDPAPAPLRRDVTLDSLYAQVQVSPLQALTFTAGVRHDDHETFGGNTSTQVAAAWSATPSTVLRASYGEGFKAPTLYQLYSIYGNTALEPEASDDWDVGIEQRVFDRVTLSATYFERDTDTMIDFVSCFGVTSLRCTLQPDGYYENIQRSHAEGIELVANARILDRLTLDANYTHLKAVNESAGSSEFGNDLPRRPRSSANAQLSYEWSIPLVTTLAAQYVGHSFDDVANRFELDSYTLVDLRARYRWSEATEIYGRIENLFDENYETARRYGSIGRGFYLGLTVSL